MPFNTRITASNPTKMTKWNKNKPKRKQKEKEMNNRWYKFKTNDKMIDFD